MPKLPKGFTFIEIMIVVALMAILAVAATTSSLSTQKQFSFMQAYKEVLGKVQEARLYSVTRLAVDDGSGDKEVPENYGVNVNSETKKITVFADWTGNDAGTYDTSDTQIGDPVTLKSDYEISFINSTSVPTPPNIINLFYTPPYGNFFAKDNAGTPINSTFLIKISDSTSTDRKKCIVILNKSGISEILDDQTIYGQTCE